ncbi:MAG: Flp pilus assembly protein CpaB [Roseiflexaceae bacterium]
MRRGGRLFLLLGILVLVAAALAYFVLSQPQSPSPDLLPTPTVEIKKQIVIARIDIPSNTILTDTETFLDQIDIPESEFKAGQYFENASDLLNKQTVRQINFNERITRPDITEPGLSILIPTAQPNQPRPKAVPVLVDSLSGVADQIRPGDFVDILTTIEIQRTIIRPGFGENNEIIFKEEALTGKSVKTLIQNVQVLQVLKPAVPQGTPGAEAPPPAAEQPGPPQTDASGQPIQPGQQTAEPQGPQTTGTFQPGDWILTLALTDQQAEIVKFSTESGTISLALRGRGDTAVDNTVGATLSLLVSQFGLPLPGAALPELISQSDLTPLPTSAATANPATTPTPTPTP